MARKKAITKRRRLLFLDKLHSTGSVTKAAVAGEVSRRAWYDLRDRDPLFADAWDEEEAFFLDNCEAESIKRSVFGEDEDAPYTHVSKDGTKETRFRTIVRKSDRLLELTLKSRHPLYKPTKALEVTSPDRSMTPASSLPDFSALDDEELRLYTVLQRKLHAAALGET
jgi:hypothetical protein